MATSYLNPGGSGQRGSIISISSDALTNNFGIDYSGLVNGNTTETNLHQFLGGSVANKHVTFDFSPGEEILIDEIKMYFGDTSTHGDWKFQASTDGSTWVDKSATFTLSGATTQTVTCNLNLSGYRYLRLFGISGTMGTSHFCEIEFKLEPFNGSLVPSYYNPGGTGARHGTVLTATANNTFDPAVQALFDGQLANNAFFAPSSTQYIRVDWGGAAPRILDELWFVQDASGWTHGDWKIQGSDDASTWVDLGGTFTLAPATSIGGTMRAMRITTPNGTTVAYRYHQMIMVSGTTNSGPWLYEIHLKVASAPVVAAQVGLTQKDVEYGVRSPAANVHFTQADVEYAVHPDNLLVITLEYVEVAIKHPKARYRWRE